MQVWSEPVGAIKYTVRFRGESHLSLEVASLIISKDIADFQWNTSKSPFVQRLTQALAVREGKTSGQNQPGADHSRFCQIYFCALS